MIVNKGTERPGSGQFVAHKEPGTYVCRRCSAALYRAEDKFDAGCGWPSFDAEVAGAVRRLPDADGDRVEIRCATCDGHLGHAFTGERFTPRDTRHCVNSVSLAFVPRADDTNHFAHALFAGGRFWGVQAVLQESRGVIRATTHYTTPAQQETTQRLIAELRGKGFAVTTRVTPATAFWPAEEMHQDYYRKTGK